MIRPLERFLAIEASSGVVLLIAAAIALSWANSPWAASYEHVWHTPITLGIGDLSFSRSLHFWINEGLMTIFFLVVGMEIRREIHEGELADLKRASLPIAAAVGGMVVPALFYLALNRDATTRHGWGIPTATDIAFAVGALALLGNRVPPALRVLLLALAIIDDIGAIVIIALFYSSGIAWSGLVIALLGLGGVILLQQVGVRRDLAYVLPGAVVWLGMLRAGIHPTIAGVVVGLATPVESWFGRRGFLAEAGSALDDFRERVERRESGHDLLPPLKRVKAAHREALAPVVRVQAALHPYVAYGVMPLFALANAGVSLKGISFAATGASAVALGVGLGLALGKPIGICAASYLSVRLGLCALPRGVSWAGVLLVGVVAGIGFTMAIFIAGLAFATSPMLAVAKLGILASSFVAAVAGLLLGRAVLAPVAVEGAALTVHEAEGLADR